MNICVAGLGESLRVIVLYSHVVPALIAGFLAFYALIKTRGSLLSWVFFVFSGSITLWLIGDLVAWGVFPNYYLVYYFWSWLDFLNVVFFVAGAYFFSLIARGRVSIGEKIFYVALCVPALAFTASGLSVLEFNQASCEALNSAFLTDYKLAVEGIAVLFMITSFVLGLKKGTGGQKKIQTSLLLGALLLFFGIFAGTEYISSTTGLYEINLYGLFSLPLFLIVMTFGVTNLGIFNLRLLGSQIFAYVLIIMSGSQLLFIQDSTQTTLSLITLGISVIFGLLLLQNAQKEQQARLQIEELARQLDTANRQQVTLIHFITHQIKGFVTKSRNLFSMMLEGDFGPVPETMRPMLQEGFDSDTKGVNTIQEILGAANIKSGKVTYVMAEFDLKALIDEIAAGLKSAADAKGLTLAVHTGDAPLMFTGDRGQLANAFKNLIDNSIKYTPKGAVEVSLGKDGGDVRFEVSDTGVGITPEDMEHLFTEGGHGKESQKVNVESTGFGLYIVKNIIEAHKGRVWAESEGTGKGSRFIVELPA
jgi:signal transduction histidine kinase